MPESVQNGNHDNTEELPSIVAFDELINSSFLSFKDLSAKIGGDVNAIVIFLICNFFPSLKIFSRPI